MTVFTVTIYYKLKGASEPRRRRVMNIRALSVAFAIRKGITLIESMNYTTGIDVLSWDTALAPEGLDEDRIV